MPHHFKCKLAWRMPDHPLLLRVRYRHVLQSSISFIPSHFNPLTAILLAFKIRRMPLKILFTDLMNLEMILLNISGIQWLLARKYLVIALWIFYLGCSSLEIPTHESFVYVLKTYLYYVSFFSKIISAFYYEFPISFLSSYEADILATQYSRTSVSFLWV